jgi:hypothetical protein
MAIFLQGVGGVAKLTLEHMLMPPQSNMSDVAVVTPLFTRDYRHKLISAIAKQTNGPSRISILQNCMHKLFHFAGITIAAAPFPVFHI